MGYYQAAFGRLHQDSTPAIVIALPISYVLTKNWLDNFAFSIDLE
jgi:hypothetical protein